MSEDMKLKLQSGYTFRQRGPDRRPRHIRGIVDDQLIIRFWSPRKGWIYTAENIRSGEFFIREGHWFMFKLSKSKNKMRLS